jgi:hypothetical protein
MIGPGGIGIHARAAFDRVEAGENLDVGGVVTTAH